MIVRARPQLGRGRGLAGSALPVVLAGVRSVASRGPATVGGGSGIQRGTHYDLAPRDGQSLTRHPLATELRMSEAIVDHGQRALLSDAGIR